MAWGPRAKAAIQGCHWIGLEWRNKGQVGQGHGSVHHGRGRHAKHQIVRSHGLNVVFIGSPQLATDLCLGLANLVNLALDGDDALHVERVDLVDGADGDLGAGFIHDFLDGGPLAANDPANQVVVGQDAQRDLLGLASVLGLLAHDLHDLVTGLGTVFGLAVDSDGLVGGAHVLFAMDIDSGPEDRR